MDRAETVRLLAEVFQTEGYSDRWRTLMDSIREHGPLHDPEWRECIDCAGEFEHKPTDASGNTRHQATRCPNCARLARNAADRRRYQKRTT